jgi:hypothetical protein
MAVAYLPRMLPLNLRPHAPPLRHPAPLRRLAPSGCTSLMRKMIG